MGFFSRKPTVEKLLADAMSGIVKAQFDLAERYYHGDGVEQDVFRAIHWYAYAAASGDPGACKRFDQLYFHGRNLENKMMGFWFERECLTHTEIPPSVPYSLSPIPYGSGDDRSRAIKATLPWSNELMRIMGERLKDYDDLAKRTFVEVEVVDGHLLDPTRQGGVAAGRKLSGKVSYGVELPSFALEVALSLGLIKKGYDIPGDLVEFHTHYAEAFCKAYFKGDYGADKLESAARFSFLKGMEQRIACDVYSGTPRHSNYNFYVAAEECSVEPLHIFTDLPQHLSESLNSNISQAIEYSSRAVKTMEAIHDAAAIQSMLFASSVLGDCFASTKGIASISIKNYRNADMLTMDEVRKIAGNVFVQQELQSKGAGILNVNFNRDYQANVLAQVGEEKRAYIVRASVYPSQAGFGQFELNRLYEGSIANGFVPYFASLCVASCDKRHFDDGVVLVGDGTKVRIDACEKLEMEE